MEAVSTSSLLTSAVVDFILGSITNLLNLALRDEIIKENDLDRCPMPDSKEFDLFDSGSCQFAILLTSYKIRCFTSA
jgi:hypothetical protein